MNSARLIAVKAALVQLASTDHRVMRAKVVHVSLQVSKTPENGQRAQMKQCVAWVLRVCDERRVPAHP